MRSAFATSYWRFPIEETAAMTTESATLAAGCFWRVKAAFDGLAGVEIVDSGYIGGHLANPTYREVCGGATGHAKAIRLVFDPAVMSSDEVLDIFFEIHDPSPLNRERCRHAIPLRGPPALSRTGSCGAGRDHAGAG